MRKKLFFNVLFGQKLVLPIFVLVVFLFMTFAGFTILQIEQEAKKSISNPDLAVYGRAPDFPFSFNPIDGLSEDLNELFGSEIKTYGALVRSMLHIGKANYTVHYMYCIIESGFFQQELAPYLVQGRLPRAGGKEVVVGQAAKHYFRANLGDIIDVRIFDDKPATKCLVVGVLDDNAEFYKGGVFVPSEIVKQEYGGSIGENWVLGYFGGHRGKAVFGDLQNEFKQILAKYDSGTVNLFFQQKGVRFQRILGTALIFISLNLVIVYLIVSYLMKGLPLKVGLLKALGVSDVTINRTFTGSLALALLLAFSLTLGVLYYIVISRNNITSAMLGYEFEFLRMGRGVYLGLLAFGASVLLSIHMMIKVKISRFEPRVAMLGLRE